MFAIIAVIVGVAGIVTYAVAKGSPSAFATQQARQQSPVNGSYPADFSSPNGGPSISSSLMGIGMSSGAAVGSAAVGAAASGTAVGTAAATAGITAGIGAVIAVATILLAKHAARLKGATNENNAALKIVPIYDQFIAQLVDALRKRTVDPMSADAVLQSFDAQVKAQLRSLVGAPGTHWSETPVACNKDCTVGCCLYFFDLHPGILSLRTVIGAGGGSAFIPKVFPGKYSQYSRESYNVTI